LINKIGEAINNLNINGLKLKIFSQKYEIKSILFMKFIY